MDITRENLIKTLKKVDCKTIYEAIERIKQENAMQSLTLHSQKIGLYD